MAIDSDANATELLVARKRLFEEKMGKKIEISVHRANALEFDYSTIAPISGVHSMFAFNMIQPSLRLLDKIVPAMANKGRFALTDGNSRCWLPRLFPSRRRSVLSPEELRSTLESRGFDIHQHSGAIALPPPVWLLPAFAVARLDRALRKNWLFSLSHQILAQLR